MAERKLASAKGSVPGTSPRGQSQAAPGSGRNFQGGVVRGRIDRIQRVGRRRSPPLHHACIHAHTCSGGSRRGGDSQVISPSREHPSGFEHACKLRESLGDVEPAAMRQPLSDRTNAPTRHASNHQELMRQWDYSKYDVHHCGRWVRRGFSTRTSAAADQTRMSMTAGAGVCRQTLGQCFLP